MKSIFINWPYPQLVDIFHYDNHITLLFVHGIDVAMYPHPLVKVEGTSHMSSTQKGFKVERKVHNFLSLLILFLLVVSLVVTFSCE
jgi:hypothetical protein